MAHVGRGAEHERAPVVDDCQGVLESVLGSAASKLLAPGAVHPGVSDAEFQSLPHYVAQVPVEVVTEPLPDAAGYGRFANGADDLKVTRTGLLNTVGHKGDPATDHRPRDGRRRGEQRLVACDSVRARARVRSGPARSGLVI